MSNGNNRPAMSFAAALNLGAIAILLWIAVGLTCEITTRNEDYARVVGYQKWLLGCESNPTADKTCTTDDLRGRIENASRQVRRFNSLNSMGALDRCSIAAVFAAPIAAFSEDCIKVMSAAPSVLNPKAPEGQPVPTSLEIATALKLQNPDQLQIYKEILSPGHLSYSGWLALDQSPKEPLYFWLVLIAATIGSLIAGLRVDGITAIGDIALGLGAGFAVYILMRSGNFVFLTGDASHIDILNPFTAGAVGFLVGLFKDRVFGLLDGVVRQPGGATTAQKAMGAAETALANAKAQQGTTAGPQALSDALTAFKQAHDEVKKL